MLASFYKYKYRLIVFLTIIFLSAAIASFVIFSNQNFSNKTDSNKPVIELPVSQVEKAANPQQRQQGLMFRQELCSKCIVLFVFEKEEIQSFWMKNTSIPLDIIFVDQNGVVNTIHPNTTPYQTSPAYRSRKPSKFVIEANSGFSQQNNLQTGNVIDINFLLEKSVPLQIPNR